MTRPRRWALALVLASFVSLSAFELFRPANDPFMDLSGKFTDHFSHMNAARLFLRFGLDIWKKPLLLLLPRPGVEEYQRLPDDVKSCPDCLFVAPGWKKPVSQSWPTVVRFYPPGDLVLTAPIAALYHFTGLSFADANRLLLVLFLALAHAGLFLMVDALLAEGMGAMAVVPLFLGANLVLRWTLEGFYDAALLVPLVLCWRYLGKGRPLAALVAFCAAAFVHFRAYYYAPWAIAAAASLWREQAWRNWTRRDAVAVAVAAVLGTASLGTFFLALPGLLDFRSYLNPLLISRQHFDGGALLIGAVIFAIAIFAFRAGRATLEVEMVCFVGLLLTQVRQSFPWYPVSLVPWLCAPPRPKESAPLVLGGRALVLLFLALYVHGNSPQPADQALPLWISSFWR